jgi:hypothetical protein
VSEAADPGKQWVANEIVGLCENLLRPHEIEDHGGELCMGERAGLVAFLAHRLGVRDQQSLLMFLDALADYEDEHEEKQPGSNGHHHLH